MHPKDLINNFFEILSLFTLSSMEALAFVREMKRMDKMSST